MEKVAGDQPADETVLRRTGHKGIDLCHGPSAYFVTRAIGVGLLPAWC
jgi:hypothetical protein